MSLQKVKSAVAFENKEQLLSTEDDPHTEHHCCYLQKTLPVGAPSLTGLSPLQPRWPVSHTSANLLIL